jgi:hypothetical protein
MSAAHYPKLQHLLGSTTLAKDGAISPKVIDYLVDQWLAEYGRTSPTSEIVETTASSFSYLFDLTQQRLVAAWGISQGKHTGARDKKRMEGHPLSQGPRYHRGHAIPHTLGGPTDINLVPQLGSVNIGAFRVLEKKAVATPGALYYTFWMYRGPKTQKPSGVEQGLLCPGTAPNITRHGN